MREVSTREAIVALSAMSVTSLTPKERTALEEYFFACDDCFEKLQATERFVAGVRDAARRGTVPSLSAFVQD